MNYTIEKARAKINISLDALQKRTDGYHDLSMIMQSLDLHDTVLIEKTSGDISVKCNIEYIPTDHRNNAYKAAKLFTERFKIHSGVAIRIDKQIPVASGLAGGSSDAAAVLKGLRKLFNIDVSDNTLCEIGLQIGADVPYCLTGGTALAEGLGEILTPLTPIKPLAVLLVKPKIWVSTHWVFNKLNLSTLNDSDRPDNHKLISLINSGHYTEMAAEMRNVLEQVTIRKHPIIQKVKDLMREYGATGSMMSGSGPTVFGLFKSEERMMKARDKFRMEQFEVIATMSAYSPGGKK